MSRTSPEWQRQQREKNQRRLLAGEVDPEHGTRSTYVYYGCRCGPCTKAMREYRRARQAAKAEAERQRPIENRRRMLAGEDHPTHGLRSTYDEYLCRCDQCTKAEQDHVRREAARRKANKRDTQRRWIANNHRRMLAGELHPTHGTYTTYRDYLCRCDLCRAANTAHLRAQRARRKTRPQDITVHGASAYTNWGCRCDVCKAANSERLRRYHLDV